MTTSTTGDSDCPNPLGLALTDQLGQAPERYVPVMDRGPQDTAHSEMLRLLELSARQAAEIERLRGLMAELLDTELAELACAGSHAPLENILGRMQAALKA